jgi:hypothetical protein
MLRFLGTALAALALLALAATSGARAQDEQAKKKAAKNMKQLALAMTNMHDTYGQFSPIKQMIKDDKPLFSWRVQILPFIEEDKLYSQFNLKEPWDSEHNKRLLDKMPKIFAPVTGKTKEKNTTHYQMITGGGALLDGVNKVSMKDITDGPANTIMIVEADEAVLWTKPDDVVYDPKKPLPKFGGVFKDGFYAAFADETVRFIKKDTDEKLIRALITRAGGEKVDLNKLK